VLVAGSTWQPDEEVIFSAYNMLTEEEKSKLRLILVPHEPTSEHLENLRSKFPDSVYLSDLLKELENSDDLSSLKEKIKAKTIIVDSIGKLLKLYANATGAYIGGAFGVGVHSVTEPAGYGIPLVCGINMKNSPDALILADKSALKIVSHSLDLYIWLRLYLNSVELQNITGLIASIYIYNSVGSSEIIVQEILIELEEINEISN
jgi:3-deoxy-D-manno-octulosonic-acid transferase